VASSPILIDVHSASRAPPLLKAALIHRNEMPSSGQRWIRAGLKA
jgi:hypothetical protein